MSAEFELVQKARALEAGSMQLIWYDRADKPIAAVLTLVDDPDEIKAVVSFIEDYERARDDEETR